MVRLQELGWSPFFQQHWNDKTGRRMPARIIEEQRSMYRVASENAELLAELSGQLRYAALDRADLPAIGDWVGIEARLTEGRATIHEVLPRRSCFSRKSAGEQTTEQIVAANIDTVFVVTSLNADLNVRRIERYLATCWDSGARPVVLLSKADVCEDIGAAIEAVSEVAVGVPIHALSAMTGEGLDPINGYLKTGETVALLGSSGVGKSTLINRLLGSNIQSVLEIREDDSRGRHATTARRLFVLPQGGMLIDTPGMRELQLWDADSGLSQAFEDIETLAANCRFRDCGHQSEPGCAVQEALSENRLMADRFESYLKLRREMDYMARKQDVLARIETTKQWKRLHKAARERYRHKGKQ